MPNRPPNGSMRIEPEYNKDPLKPKEHQLLVETSKGEYTILGTTSEPIELLRVHTAGRHACNMQAETMVILDKDTREIEERFENYVPQPQDPDAPINDANLAIRDRWVGSILKWLLSRDLWDAEDNEETQAKVRAELDAMGVELAISPGGCQVLFTRNGETLSAWSCS